MTCPSESLFKMVGGNVGRRGAVSRRGRQEEGVWRRGGQSVILGSPSARRVGAGFSELINFVRVLGETLRRHRN